MYNALSYHKHILSYKRFFAGMYYALLRKRPLKLDKISVVQFPFPHTSVYYKKLSKESTSKTEQGKEM